MIRTPEHEVVQFDGPVLELMTESRTRFDQRLAGLGPDILAEELDSGAFLRRLRQDDPTRGIADALLDQRNIAGIGNLWKAEACFLAGVHPGGAWPRCPTTLALELVEGIRPLMQDSADRRLPGPRSLGLRAPGTPLPPLRHDHPRPRAGRRQPHHLLVPGVPGVIRVGHKGAAHVAPGNTIESFEAALEHGVDMVEFDILRTRDGRLVLAHDCEDAAGASASRWTRASTTSRARPTPASRSTWT